MKTQKEMMYYFEELENNKDLMDQLKEKLGNQFCGCKTVVSLANRIEDLNTSRDIYTVCENGKFTSDLNDEYIFEKYGYRETNAYIQVELYRSGSFVRLWGKYLGENFDEDDQCFSTVCFGDYFAIEIVGL